MKLQLAIVIGAILVGSIATVNYAFVQNNELSVNALKSTAGMLGHITLTATDENGNIKAYRQTDNVIINNGDNCLVADTFNVSVGSCGATQSAYDDVHIGTGSGPFGETSTILSAWKVSTAGSVGSITPASATVGASVIVTANFIDVSASIAEAALYNSANSAGADVLALQSFTAIPLGPTDDLTVQWTISIDGS